MYLWTWYGYADPGQTLGSYTTSQIEGWNEPCWSSPEYDRAYAQQAVQLDPQKRKQYIDVAQQAMYADSPQSITVYPRLLQAINTKQWTGWIFNAVGGGQAVFRSASQKSYLTVKPASTAGATGASSTWVWAVVAVVAALVILLVVVLVRRGRRSEEEPV